MFSVIMESCRVTGVGGGGGIICIDESKSLIGAWKYSFPSFKETDQPTDRPTNGQEG